jgi:hypothetical protein
MRAALNSGLELEAEWDADQGKPGREVGGQLDDAPPQALGEVLALVNVSEQHGAQRKDQRPEGAERGVWAGLHADDGEVRGLVQ